LKSRKEARVTSERDRRELANMGKVLVRQAGKAVQVGVEDLSPSYQRTPRDEGFRE
jgi:hypothetical protein